MWYALPEMGHVVLKKELQGAKVGDALCGRCYAKALRLLHKAVSKAEEEKELVDGMISSDQNTRTMGRGPKKKEEE